VRVELLACLLEVLLDAPLFVGLGGADDLVAEGLPGVGVAPTEPVAFKGSSGCTPAGAGSRVMGWDPEFGDKPVR